MRTNVHETAQLGELVVVAFDEAAEYSSDPRDVSRLATRAVLHMLRRARKTSPPPRQQHAPRGVTSPEVGGTSTKENTLQ